MAPPIATFGCIGKRPARQQTIRHQDALATLRAMSRFIDKPLRVTTSAVGRVPLCGRRRSGQAACRGLAL